MGTDERAALAVIETTGETIDLTGPDEGVFAGLKMIDGYISALQDVRKTVNDEAIRRIDRTAKFSGTMGGQTYKVPSPDAGITYDVDNLAEAVKTLVEDGVIELPAFDNAFRREVSVVVPDAGFQALKPWLDRNVEKGLKYKASWKMQKVGLNAILKVAGDRGTNLVKSYELSSAPRRVKVG